MDIWLITLILVVAVFFLISERMPLDLTGIGILAVLMVTKILTTEEVLRGFANPAIITIASMLILSRGLARTGALELVSERIIEYSGGSEKWILLTSMIVTAVASAFINNTPVVVLFITVIMSVCCEYGLSPSKFLIPVSYASILGGTSTLVGTSTNLIVSDLSFKAGYGAIGMFELSPVGVTLTCMSLGFLYFAAPRFMPDHKAPYCELKPKDAPHYLTEVLVRRESRLIGQEPLAYFSQRYPGIELFEVVRGPIIYFPEREKIGMAQDDLLLLKGSANDLVALLRDNVVELPHKIEGPWLKPREEKSLIAELIVTPQSNLIGEQPILSHLQEELGIQIIAVKRRGIHYADQKIRHLRLSIGDILLVQCSMDRIEEIRNKPDFIIIEDVHHRIVDKSKAPLAITLFVGLILAASAGIADITVCAATAVFLMVVLGCLNLRDAYRAVNPQVLLVLVATIALGTAMEKTGAAKLYADLFLTLFRGLDPAITLAALILLTILLSEVMSNAATAVLLLPIAISTALTLGVSPRPFIVGVCFGASCAFAVPIGYQTHLLVYGPGGYRLTDYLKMGIPLDLIAWLTTALLIPRLWPF